MWPIRPLEAGKKICISDKDIAYDKDNIDRDEYAQRVITIPLPATSSLQSRTEAKIKTSNDSEMLSRVKIKIAQMPTSRFATWLAISRTGTLLPLPPSNLKRRSPQPADLLIKI